MGFLAGLAVIHLIQIPLSIAGIFIPYDWVARKGAVPAWLMVTSLMQLLQIPLFFSTALVFLIWFYRVYKNLIPLRAEYLDTTPGWAVGYWFIPILTLFRPFQVMRDIWNESDPEFDPELNFLSQSSGTPALLGFWWASWLCTLLFTNASNFILRSNGNASLNYFPYFLLPSAAISVVAAILAILIIKKVSQRQDERFNNLARMQNFSAPPPPPVFS
jgi:hypothetical protein